MNDFVRRPEGDRERAAYLQRHRRARIVRIDYTPSAQALAIINAKRGSYFPLNNNSGVINAIVLEWARLVGPPDGEAVQPKTPELDDKYAHARVTTVTERSARAQEFGGLPEFRRQSQARARAYESGSHPPLPHPPAAAQRVACGARRHRDGKPCQSQSEPGKKRCRFHGGRSTGPRSPEGRARALANLRQYRAAQVENPPFNVSEEITACA